MGQVKTTIEVSNLLDRARRIEVEAVVDTGATLLSLPRRQIEQLALPFGRELAVRTSKGRSEGESTRAPASSSRIGRPPSTCTR